jgi:uncharacterized protein (DUF924 family)
MDFRAREVLDYWFGPLADGFADAAHRRRWFAGGAEMDAEITRRFGDLVAAARAGSLDAWRVDGPSALALILVSDQFSRQVHRATVDAFATDALALDVALALIEQRVDRQFGFDERAFLYLPLEHSERSLHQHASVGLYTLLRDETPAGQRHLTGDYLRHAQQHRDIIQRFGRFPHRNAVLGRASSAEERAFIADSGSFGQSPEPG